MLFVHKDFNLDNEMFHISADWRYSTVVSSEQFKMNVVDAIGVKLGLQYRDFKKPTCWRSNNGSS